MNIPNVSFATLVPISTNSSIDFVLEKICKAPQSSPYYFPLFFIPTQLSSSQICGSINRMSVMEPGTLKELEYAINSKLPPKYSKSFEK